MKVFSRYFLNHCRFYCSDSVYSFPLRTFMYVPGDDERKILKASKCKADMICLDCEDGVAVTKKASARETIRKTLDSSEFKTDTSICVRINSTQSEEAKLDIDSALAAERLPDAICLSKVENPSDMDWLFHKMYNVIRGREGARCRLLFMCESPMGLLNLELICQHLIELTSSQETPIDADAVVFGGDDWRAAVGAERTVDDLEVLYPRLRILSTVKAFGLRAIDMVHTQLNDIEGLQKHSASSAQLGFSGRQIIHPSQVDAVNQAYTPSTERIDYAKRLLAAFDDSQLKGKGAFNFEGRMIDQPLYLQAKNIVNLAEKLNL